MSSAIIINFDKPIDTKLLGFSKYNERPCFILGIRIFLYMNGYI